MHGLVRQAEADVAVFLADEENSNPPSDSSGLELRVAVASARTALKYLREVDAPGVSELRDLHAAVHAHLATRSSPIPGLRNIGRWLRQAGKSDDRPCRSTMCRHTADLISNGSAADTLLAQSVIDHLASDAHTLVIEGLRDRRYHDEHPQ